MTTQSLDGATQLAQEISQIADSAAVRVDPERYADLLAMEARFRAFLRSSQDAVLLADPSGRVQEWNEGAERLFQLSGAELRTRLVESLLEIPVLEDQPEHQISTIRMQGIRGDGEQFPADVSFAASPTPSGTVYTFMIRDVSGEELLKAQLLQAQKLEAIGALAAGVAHEINTPAQYVNDNTRFLQASFRDCIPLLRTIQELLTSSEKAGELPPALLKSLGAAAAAADLDYLLTEIPLAIEQSLEGMGRITEIVRSMKALSHPGGQTQEFRAENLNELIQQAITVCTGEWKYVATVETDFDPALPPVECRHGEVTQVLLNLLVNAAHAIAEARDSSTAPKGRIRVTTQHLGQRVQISVSDTGTGIPDHILSRVFDPFFTTKAVGKGTGQGLAIAWSVIVEKHGGTLTCESVEGQGTSFTITLPLRQSGGAG